MLHVFRIILPWRRPHVSKEVLVTEDAVSAAVEALVNALTEHEGSPPSKITLEPQPNGEVPIRWQLDNDDPYPEGRVIVLSHTDDEGAS